MLFGDAEPEDAWDPDDPIVDLVRNLARRVPIIRGELDDIDRRHRDRLVMLEDDLVHVLRRLEDAG